MRVWLASDPDPNAEGAAVRAVADDHGEVWCYEVTYTPCSCCGRRACDKVYDRGWWSPTIGKYDLADWADLFTERGDGQPAPTRVHELTPEQEQELTRETFS